ncbi:GlsB/YeaQ/YmgE family stress response membrane protein [Kordia jejudonensis]|uniref:GlsB/YeaQ/YmgE family stress response membrane protein n=1 Tax=Kordia jejudonensis TaxID=1348245 RepID=UPI0006297CE3|nr:GlsB/YeaQ/YmgE family stress response membrane protein [Kordia jejudonensis]
MGLLYSLFIGAVAGWLAGKLMKGGGFGLLINIILGILGGVLAGWLFGKLDVRFASGILGDILKGAVGASIILLIANLLKKK